jgi:hypothetical protein
MSAVVEQPCERVPCGPSVLERLATCSEFVTQCGPSEADVIDHVVSVSDWIPI